MIWLRQLAAWYLQRSVRGYTHGANGAGTLVYVTMYGEGWQLTKVYTNFNTMNRTGWNK